MICGPGQGLTGQMQADFQAGLGVVLAGTFYPTKSSADRQSIVRCYASENDYGTGLPVVEISMSDSHDLVFRVTETQVMLDARILAPLLGKPMTVVAVVPVQRMVITPRRKINWPARVKVVISRS